MWSINHFHSSSCAHFTLIKYFSEHYLCFQLDKSWVSWKIARLKSHILWDKNYVDCHMRSVSLLRYSVLIYHTFFVPNSIFLMECAIVVWFWHPGCSSIHHLLVQNKYNELHRVQSSVYGHHWSVSVHRQLKTKFILSFSSAKA